MASGTGPFWYKAIIIGNSGVGKTTLFHRLLFDTFVDTSTRTNDAGILLDCYEKNVNLSGEEIKIDLHDCQGRERFRTRNINNLYHRADVVFLTFSIVDISSFEDLTTWIKECKDNLWGSSVHQLVWAVIANKSDLPCCEVDSERIQGLCDLLNTTLVFHVSAKTGSNVHNSFKKIITALHEQRKAASMQEKSSIVLDKHHKNKHHQCCVSSN